MSKLTISTVLSKSRAGSLDTVRNLNCWGSEINDISIVRRMPNLEILSLSVNNLSSLKDLTFCPKLKEIYLRKNSVQDIEEIRYLKNLSNLKVLWLSDNPCALDRSYRPTIIRNLTTLKKLDNVDITDEERSMASLQGIMLTTPVLPRDNFDICLQGSTENEDQGVASAPDRDEKPPPTSNCIHGVSPVSSPRETRSLSRTSNSKEISTTSSLKQDGANVLPAILLLMNELEVEDLRTVVKEAEDRIRERKLSETIGLDKE